MVEFENPIGDVGEEIAVVGDDDERPLELLEIRFQPERRLRVEMVRRFVKKKNVGICEQEPRDGDAAALATRKNRNLLVAGRAAEVGHPPLNEIFKVPVVVAVDDLLQPLHFGGGLRVVELAAEILVALHHRLRLGDALHNGFEHRLGIVKLRLLREIPHLCPLRDLHRAHQLGVETGENLQ